MKTEKEEVLPRSGFTASSSVFLHRLLKFTSATRRSSRNENCGNGPFLSLLLVTFWGSYRVSSSDSSYMSCAQVCALEPLQPFIYVWMEKETQSSIKVASSLPWQLLPCEVVVVIDYSFSGHPGRLR
mmetsp:Transcript_34277/g.134419  ORF Transcript_34277/g.134419 Transcript_34277/m.134419 type:complete len:127 (+) Transcript_34277:1843-2223(+)